MNPILQTAKTLAARAAKSCWASLEANATPVNPGDLVTWRKATGLYLDPLTLFCYQFLTFSRYGDNMSLSAFLSGGASEFPANFIEHYNANAIISSRGGQVIEQRIPVLFIDRTDTDLVWLDPLEVKHLKQDDSVCLQLGQMDDFVLPLSLISKATKTTDGWKITLRTELSAAPSDVVTLVTGEEPGCWQCDAVGLSSLAKRFG